MNRIYIDNDMGENVSKLKKIILCNFILLEKQFYSSQKCWKSSILMQIQYIL